MKLKAEARAILEAQATDGSNAHVRELALVLLEEDGDKQKALELAKIDINIRPGDIGANYVLAKALRLNGELEKAKEYIDKALRYNTPNADYQLEAEVIEKALTNIK